MKHNWFLDEDGKPDEFAYENGFHLGVICQDCGKCVCVHCKPDWLEMDDCPGPRKRKPMTNADRIRAMSDEELAELFDGIVDNGKSCSLICGDLDNCKRNNSIERICKNHYLKWLKQPAE